MSRGMLLGLVGCLGWFGATGSSVPVASARVLPAEVGKGAAKPTAAAGAAGGARAGHGPACSDEDLVKILPITPTRRLNRYEYHNVVADVLPGFPVEVLLPPQDDKVAGFLGNTEVLVTDSTSRVYQAAAEEIGRIAAQRAAELYPRCRGKARNDAACARQVLEGLGGRLFRRALSADEKRAYFDGLYAPIAAEQGVASGLEAMVAALFQSVNFLYRFEVGDPRAAASDLRLVSDMEMASRLSFLLWSSIPDERLIARARQGRLHTPRDVREEAERMVRDPRTRRTLHAFFDQLLRLDRLHQMRKAAPEFQERGRDTAFAETHAFIDHVIWAGKGGLPDLLTARYSFIDATLARLYGLPPPPGEGLRFVSWGEEIPRAGLLTQATFLAAQASAGEASVTQRGLAIREGLLCQDLPQPPPGTVMDPAVDRLKQMPCKSCHVMMDLIGNGFERYDHIGRLRSLHEGKPIDEAGRVILAKGIPPDFKGPIELAHNIANSAHFSACMVKHWFRYGFARREIEEVDDCALARLEKALADAGGDFRAVMVAATQLPEFRYLKIEPAPTPSAEGAPLSRR